MVKTTRKYVTILGINVTGTSTPVVLAGVENFIAKKHKFYIVTPNPELVLMSEKNKELREALNGADLAIPDAIGLSQAAKYLSLPLSENKLLRMTIGFFQGLIVGAATFFNSDWLTNEINPIKGRVLFLDLIKLANKNKWKVFLLGGMNNEAGLTREKLGKRYSDIKILSDRGPILDKNARPVTEVDTKLEKDVIDKINKIGPDLLFVAMTNPKQEIWIHKNISKLNIRGAMAVGGTFRYISGLSKLPPKWMEKAGLEWVFRLFTEPYRIGRILNAFPIFPLRVFWLKISGR